MRFHNRETWKSSLHADFLEVEKDVTVYPSAELDRPRFSPRDTEVLHTSLFLLYFLWDATRFQQIGIMCKDL